MSLIAKQHTSGSDGIGRVLEELRDGLTNTLGDGLTALIVYGDYIRPGRFHVEHSRVNVMLVLRTIDCDTLAKLAPSVTDAEQKIRLATMIVTQADLVSSCDVFPVKFHDIQTHHRLLVGEDVLDDLEISDDHLRLRCEQELKNLMIRLGWVYVHLNGDASGLWQALSESAGSFFRILDACLTVKTGVTPEAEADVLDMFAEEFQINADIVKEILRLWDGHSAPPDDQLKAMFDGFMKLVRESAHAVDQLEDVA